MEGRGLRASLPSVCGGVSARVCTHGRVSLNSKCDLTALSSSFCELMAPGLPKYFIKQFPGDFTAWKSLNAFTFESFPHHLCLKHILDLE